MKNKNKRRNTLYRLIILTLEINDSNKPNILILNINGDILKIAAAKIFERKKALRQGGTLSP